MRKPVVLDSGTVVRKEACPKCRAKGEDTSGDNLTIYRNKNGEESAHCWACGYTIPSSEYLASVGSHKKRGHSKPIEQPEPEFCVSMSTFTDKDHADLKSITTFAAKGLRGIRDETYKKFGIRHELATEDLPNGIKAGQPCKQYYPNTKEGKLTGYKVRVLPKETFFALGENSGNCELFGQNIFKDSSSRFCVIVGGEVDTASAYQMLQDANVAKGGDFPEIPVVSPTLGETGSGRQVASQYAWFDRFEKIYLCMDNDEAGEKATEIMAGVLPKGKVYVIHMSRKDPNEYLMAGPSGAKEFIQAFWKAQKYSPAGILSSLGMNERILERLHMTRLPLPEFMAGVDALTRGLPLGYIVNIVSGSGTGKSTVANEMVYYWLMRSPYKIGVASFEADCGEYGQNLLSRHLGIKLANLPEEEAISLLQEPWVGEKSKLLWEVEEGVPRFELVDDRGDFSSIQSKIEAMVISCGCQIIVVDPLSDAMAGMSNEEQEDFMAWQKSMVKSHNITFINICHARKSAVGQKANSRGNDELTEEDIHGSSAIYKSGACNIIMTRDKLAENEIDRNTTTVKVTKCRWSGRTGPAGAFYYDNKTHTLYDKDFWLQHVMDTSANYQ